MVSLGIHCKLFLYFFRRLFLFIFLFYYFFKLIRSILSFTLCVKEVVLVSIPGDSKTFFFNSVLFEKKPGKEREDIFIKKSSTKIPQDQN